MPMVARSFRKSHDPTPSATAVPTEKENQAVLRTRLIIIEATSSLRNQSLILLWNPSITYGRAALVRMSSLPESRSSMKPNVWALASLTARNLSTVRLRRLYSTNSTTREKAVSTRPARHSSRKSSTRMPTSRIELPSICMTNVEKKLPSSSVSPSIRSIISPGVCRLWNDMSSFMQWRARSPRSALVAVQPTRPLV